MHTATQTAILWHVTDVSLTEEARQVGILAARFAFLISGKLAHVDGPAREFDCIVPADVLSPTYGYDLSAVSEKLIALMVGKAI